MPLATQVFLVTAVVLAIAERIPRLRRKRSPLFRPHAVTDVIFLLVVWIASADLAIAWVRWGTGLIDGPAAHLAVPLWLQVIASIVLLDLGNYACHRLLHRFDILWRLHEVHHSSPTLDWLATFRSHALEQVLRRVIAPLLLIAVGMPAAAVAIASAIFLAWAVANHANLAVDLRFLEPLFITPRLHHLHHVPASSSHNFGTVFSLWDRLLGRLDTREVAGDTPLGAPGARPGYPETFVALHLEPFA
jgi:sterol desaturase/sphingolipid hydroxylase (fatty acid hydroxylase superfamily)